MLFTVSQVVDALPPHAKDRYESLQAQAADADVLVGMLQTRYSKPIDAYHNTERPLRHATRINNGEEVAKLQAELTAMAAKSDRLDRERSKRVSVQTNAVQTLHRLNSFLEAAFGLSGALNVPQPLRTSITPELLLADETAIDAVKRLRQEIFATKTGLAMIKSAPLPAQEVCLAIMRQVEAMAEQGKPRLSITGTEVKLTWADQHEFALAGTGALMAPAGSASKMMAWLFRDELMKKLVREVGVKDPPGAIPARDRPEKTRVLEERLWALEVQEEHFISVALSEGCEVHRRSDANPWTTLGYGLALEAPAPLAEAAE
jgi:hypothetical protein